VNSHIEIEIYINNISTTYILHHNYMKSRFSKQDMYSVIYLCHNLLVCPVVTYL